LTLPAFNAVESIDKAVSGYKEINPQVDETGKTIEAFWLPVAVQNPLFQLNCF